MAGQPQKATETRPLHSFERTVMPKAKTIPDGETGRFIRERLAIAKKMNRRLAAKRRNGAGELDFVHFPEMNG